MDEETARRIQALEKIIQGQGTRIAAQQKELQELRASVGEARSVSAKASYDNISTVELLHSQVLQLQIENRKLFELERGNRKREMRRVLKQAKRGGGENRAWFAGLALIIIVAGLVAAKLVAPEALVPTVIALGGALAALVYRDQKKEKQEEEDDERVRNSDESIHPGELSRETLPTGGAPPGLRLPR
jgi:hypothetical protein